MVTQDPFYRWNNCAISLRAKLKSMPDTEAFNSQLWAPLTTTYLQIHTWQTWKLVFKSVKHSSFSAGKILRKNGYRSKSTQKDTQIVFFYELYLPMFELMSIAIFLFKANFNWRPIGERNLRIAFQEWQVLI